MSGRRTPPHCGQIPRPCRKARRHVERTVWDHCEMSAYRTGHGLKMRSYSSETHRTATTRHRVSVGHEMGVAGACRRCNAEARRGCPLPSRDASSGSENVAEMHSGRLASRGWPLRDAKTRGSRSSANMGISDK
ncbi:UNVERIFIED_CONTAM: hypothetical protein Sradi_0684300 [Sesamum radiatum]|uniref:Uncharacterized protein n=1 Tax=Sesamum radiatum TaxID=300843 RepID=A0AAW2VMS8_SESRA